MAELIRNMEFKNLIGAAIILLFFVSHIATLIWTVPEGNESLVQHSLGILDAATIAIVSFYYGSSAGSKEKGEAINKALKTEQEKS